MTMKAYLAMLERNGISCLLRSLYIHKFSQLQPPTSQFMLTPRTYNDAAVLILLEILAFIRSNTTGYFSSSSIATSSTSRLALKSTLCSQPMPSACVQKMRGQIDNLVVHCPRAIPPYFMQKPVDHVQLDTRRRPGASAIYSRPSPFSNFCV